MIIDDTFDEKKLDSLNINPTHLEIKYLNGSPKLQNKILKKFTKLNELVIDLRCFDKYNNMIFIKNQTLKKLHVRINKEIQNFDPFSYLPDLEELCIENYSEKVISTISLFNLKKLKTYSLINNDGIINKNMFLGCYNIENLELILNDQFSLEDFNIKSYETLSNVKIFKIKYNNYVDKIFKNLTNLEVLIISEMTFAIEDILTLKKLKNLKCECDQDNLNVINDYSFIENMEKLKNLHLIKCQNLYNWNIKYFRNLENLILENCDIVKEITFDITPLDSLTYVRIIKCKVGKIISNNKNLFVQ
jgi:hypothetical protein